MYKTLIPSFMDDLKEPSTQRRCLANEGLGPCADSIGYHNYNQLSEPSSVTTTFPCSEHVVIRIRSGQPP
jgi:hypothetical protein